jgi:hypothetical protein
MVGDEEEIERIFYLADYSQVILQTFWNML